MNEQPSNMDQEPMSRHEARRQRREQRLAGFGVFSNFGLGLEYDEDWSGRYYAQKAALIGMSAMPETLSSTCSSVAAAVW